MKINGLELLLLFAYGPVKKGICADKSFARKIEGYLSGNGQLKEEIKKELPLTLTNAWKNLQKIADTMNLSPLDQKVVQRYVFFEHNENVMPNCAVHKGLSEVVDMKKRLVYVNTSSGQVEKLQFLPIFDDLIGQGREYFYHHGWLVAITGKIKKG